MNDKDAYAELVAVSDDWARAIVSNDAELIARFAASDCVIVSDSGISPRDAFLAVVASGDLTHSAMDRLDEPRIRVYGDTAVLTARVTNTAHYGGHRFDADEWTTDVFVRREGRWQCVLTHIATSMQLLRIRPNGMDMCVESRYDVRRSGESHTAPL